VFKESTDKLQSRFGDKSTTKGGSTKNSKEIQKKSIINFRHKSQFEGEK
jgi:hypothetical protein